MSSLQTCPRCGSPFAPQDGLRNLCPKCLMQCVWEDSEAGNDDAGSDPANEAVAHEAVERTVLSDELAGDGQAGAFGVRSGAEGDGQDSPSYEGAVKAEGDGQDSPSYEGAAKAEGDGQDSPSYEGAVKTGDGQEGASYGNAGDSGELDRAAGEVRGDQQSLIPAKGSDDPESRRKSHAAAKRQWNFRFQPGDRVLDGYTIVGPLGHGGFGEVYHARSDAGKETALKLVQRYLDVELRGVGHCLNLKHQNLVTIYDVRPDSEGRDWIVMEFVAGESLAYEIDRHPQGLPLERLLYWLEGIVAGVEHLHQAGVVHRDLKPSNIFEDHGTVKVGDYGLSKFITASRRSGQTQSVGTLHYMAPEVGGGRYGREVDVYAVGVMLYEMLTGDVPFDGQTPTEILMKHLTAAPDISKLPAAFRGVVARMLAKHPEERYGSVQAAWIELQARRTDESLIGTAGDAEPSIYGQPSYYSSPGASTWLEERFAALMRPLQQRAEEEQPAEPVFTETGRERPRGERRNRPRRRKQRKRPAPASRWLSWLLIVPMTFLLLGTLGSCLFVSYARVDHRATATATIEESIANELVPAEPLSGSRRMDDAPFAPELPGDDDGPPSSGDLSGDMERADPGWKHAPWPPTSDSAQPPVAVRVMPRPQQVPDMDFAYGSASSKPNYSWAWWVQLMAGLAVVVGLASILLLRRDSLSRLQVGESAISQSGVRGESWGRGLPSNRLPIGERMQVLFRDAPLLTWLCLFLTLSLLSIPVALYKDVFRHSDWEGFFVLWVFVSLIGSAVFCLWCHLLTKEPQPPAPHSDERVDSAGDSGRERPERQRSSSNSPLRERPQVPFRDAPALWWAGLFFMISLAAWGALFLGDIPGFLFLGVLVAGVFCLGWYLLTKQPQPPARPATSGAADRRELVPAGAPEFGNEPWSEPFEHDSDLPGIPGSAEMPAPPKFPVRPSRRTGILKIVGTLLIAAFWGLGAGLLTAGVLLSAMPYAPWRHELAGSWGAGIGFLVAAVIATRCAVALSSSALLRLVVSLFWGAAVGLAVGAWILTMGLNSRSAEEAAVCMGFGAGLLTAAVIARAFFTGRMMIPPRLDDYAAAALAARGSYTGRPQALLGMAVAGLMAGFGIGLLTGGYFPVMNLRADEAAVMSAFSLGLLTAGTTWFRLLRRTKGYWPMRAGACLFLAGGIGCLIGGGLLFNGLPEDVAALVGLGAGFLTCGLAGYFSLINRPAVPRR